MSKENVFKDVYIVESSYASKNWYRIWSDGWIEQGGMFENGYIPATLSFVKPYTTKANVILTRTRRRDGDGHILGILENSVTTTGFSVRDDYFSSETGTDRAQQVYWRAEGY